MKSRLPQILLTCLLLVFFANVSNAQKIKVTPDQVPAEFQGFNDTLLVISMPGFIGYNKFLEKNFKEHYTGRFRIISPKEYRKSGRGNHRYVFQAFEDYSLSTKMEIYYTIIDQDNGKLYKTMSHRYYSDLMIAYLKELDAARTKKP